MACWTRNKRRRRQINWHTQPFLLYSITAKPPIGSFAVCRKNHILRDYLSVHLMVVVTVTPSMVVVEVLFISLQLPLSIVTVDSTSVGPTSGMFWVVIQSQVFVLLHPTMANMAATATRIITFFILMSFKG